MKDVLKEVKSSEKGLSKKEVKRKLEQNGENIIQGKKRRSKGQIFLAQFKNFMVILLLIVGVLSFFYALFETHDYLDSIVILGTTLINVFMGYLQEDKAEDAVEKLKQYNITKVNVTRDGVMEEVPSTELVVGDVIEIEAGDSIPADARIIESYFAKADESVLTGESNSVTKNADTLTGNVSLHERSNMVYAGTNLVSGKVKAVVCATSMQTEIGKIAKAINTSEEPITSLQVKVKKVSTFITMVAIVLVVFVLIVSVIKDYDMLMIVMLCISMIVASVPECLPIAITSTLMIGVKAMAKKKTVVRNMAAIETLGATEIICTDKTGTLTMNQMEVVECYFNLLDINLDEYSLHKNDVVLAILALCNTSTKNKKGEYIGDAVDVALLNYLESKKVSSESVKKQYMKVVEIPFDSERKMMSFVYQKDGEKTIFTKGSTQSVLKNCSFVLKNGKVQKLTKLNKDMILEKEESLSRKALKVIALAFKDNVSNHSEEEDYMNEESHLTFVGLVAMKDPARSDVKNAILKCKSAHIRPIMITGDSLDTALAIAEEVGIIESGEEGILGNELDKMTPKELKKCVNKYNVFARVSPDHKYILVDALQRQGKVVAMTGDGVNDAPALQMANVGIGMGESGTDVTKSVSDILLLDDSFSTIVTAVSEGRRIYDNVIANVLYNLSSNFTEIVLIILGMFLNNQIILALHVLYIDLVADTVPSICLAFESASKKNMKKKPNGLDKPIFTPYFFAFLILSVIVEAGVSLIVYFVSIEPLGVTMAQTLALLSVVLNEFVFAYNCRSLREGIFDKGLFSNKQLNLGILILIGVQLLVFLTPIGSIFSLEVVNIGVFILVFAVNLISLLIIEAFKPILNRIFPEE